MNLSRSIPKLPGPAAMAVILAALMLGSSTGCASDDRPDTSLPARQPDLSTPPSGIHWLDFYGVALPVGADGPRNYTSTAATGFTQNPQGAALAAIVHTIRMSLAPDDAWAAIAKSEILSGPGKDEWVIARGLLSIRSPADPTQAPRVRGYTITDYTPAAARVDVYTCFPDTSVAVNTATVVWAGGDWWLALPALDSTEPRIRSAASITAVVKLEPPQ